MFSSVKKNKESFMKNSGFMKNSDSCVEMRLENNWCPLLAIFCTIWKMSFAEFFRSFQVIEK